MSGFIRATYLVAGELGAQVRVGGKQTDEKCAAFESPKGHVKVRSVFNSK